MDGSGSASIEAAGTVSGQFTTGDFVVYYKKKP